MWLMVQIWFGNTSLSFSQAESFHKILGPILMVSFAALSNTLLITSMSSSFALGKNSLELTTYSLDGNLVEHVRENRFGTFRS